jgi:hypothetical protein
MSQNFYLLFLRGCRRCFSVLGFDEYIEGHSDGLQILRYNQTKVSNFWLAGAMSCFVGQPAYHMHFFPLLEILPGRPTQHTWTGLILLERKVGLKILVWKVEFFK